jgi:ATP-dependent RNA helicase DeaD
MSHPGARKVEPEEREERGSGRSQNVVHTLPRSMASVPNFLTGPLERLDPAEGTTQVLVLTADPESAVAIAEAVLRMTGPAGIELIPITSARRASRLMAARPVLAAAGSPRDIRDLVKGSHLKLESVKAVVLAWAEEILAGDADDIEALEAVMSELPKDAARIVVTSRAEGRVNAFAERYLRRAHRETPVDADAVSAPLSIQYLTVAPGSRDTALRRLLDDLDPPSAVVVASTDDAGETVGRNLRLLGYRSDASAVRVTRGEITPSTYAVIFYEMPASHAQIAAATEAGAVSIIALVERRELAALRRMAGGEVKPFTLAAAGDTAREREVSIRRELSNVIDSGLAARDVLALEPLLDRHDGIEIAAAALRLLEKERTLRKAAEAEVRARADAPPRPPASRPEFDRGPREFRGPPRDKRPGGDRPGGFRGPREGGRDSGPRGGRDAGARGGPPRRDSQDRRPPRDGTSRPPRRDR